MIVVSDWPTGIFMLALCVTCTVCTKLDHWPLITHVGKGVIIYVVRISFTLYVVHMYHIRIRCTYIDCKGLEFLTLESHPKPVKYLLCDSRAVLIRHSQAQRCLEINSKPLHWAAIKFLKILKKNFLLTIWLTPSDKHNSEMAKATGLISSLILVASSRDMLFHQPQQLQCLYHGATKAYRDVPLFSFVLHSLLPYRIGDDMR